MLPMTDAAKEKGIRQFQEMLQKLELHEILALQVVLSQVALGHALTNRSKESESKIIKPKVIV